MYTIDMETVDNPIVVRHRHVETLEDPTVV